MLLSLHYSMLFSLQGNFNYIVIDPTKHSNVIRHAILNTLALYFPPTEQAINPFFE